MAQDGGLRIVFGLENRLEVSRNSGFRFRPPGPMSLTLFRLSFGLFSGTEIDRLEFSVSGALIAENNSGSRTEFDFGRGAADLAYHREVPATVLDLGAFYRNDNVDAFDDALADADETGTRVDYGVTAGLEIGRTSSIGLALGAAYEATDFQDASDPELYDSTETRADAAVIFHASEIASARLGLRYSLREKEDPAATRTETVTTYAGLAYAISQRLDLAAEIGYAETRHRRVRRDRPDHRPRPQPGVDL